MTLNNVIARILRYFTEFDSFAHRLGHTSQVLKIVLLMSAEYPLPRLAETDPRSSRMVSLR